MSDETGNGVFVLRSVSGCYAEVHISWEIFGAIILSITSDTVVFTASEIIISPTI